MAKAAKSVEPEISEQRAKKFINEVMSHLESIESAKGVYMAAARNEREGITSQLEAMAAHGISQKISKLVVKIAVTSEKVRGWQADLEAEERKLAVKLTKAIGDRRQMSLWGDLPSTSKKPRKAAKKVAKLTVVPTEETAAAAS